MGKIKLNLVSGAIVEKPLINAFKANNNSYIVFDNEINGSMGLPIILVCKLENGKLVKIVDQNEWQIVKEYLKNIIAGNQIEFIKVDSELAADDIYYTQLTLPVPSFDALKNAYKVEDSTDTTISNINPEPSINVVEAISPVEPVSPVAPVAPEVQEPVIDNPQPVINPTEPVIDIAVPEQNVVSAPEVNVGPTIDMNTPMPTFGESVVSPLDIVPPVAPQPVIQPESVINPEVNLSVTETSIFQEQKEAFMQACENMFDALVQKFEKELENRK